MIPDFSKMTDEEAQAEVERCKDPLYFHNKYSTYPGKRELSRKEWNEMMYFPNPIRPRNPMLRTSSCDISCGPSDWYKGGKCDKNGCYYE